MYLLGTRRKQQLSGRTTRHIPQPPHQYRPQAADRSPGAHPNSLPPVREMVHNAHAFVDQAPNQLDGPHDELACRSSHSRPERP